MQPSAQNLKPPKPLRSGRLSQRSGIGGVCRTECNSSPTVSSSSEVVQDPAAATAACEGEAGGIDGASPVHGTHRVCGTEVLMSPWGSDAATLMTAAQWDMCTAERVSIVPSTLGTELSVEDIHGLSVDLMGAHDVTTAQPESGSGTGALARLLEAGGRASVRDLLRSHHCTSLWGRVGLEYST